MVLRAVTGCLAAAAYLLTPSVAFAECTMDNDCPADLICEDAACIAPPPATAPTSAAPRLAAATPASAPRTALAGPVQEPAPPAKLRGKRHSSGMMVGGIVLTSLSVIPFTVALLGTVSCADSVCDGAPYFFGGMAATGLLLGLGIPMIAIGGKREPLSSARVAPWIAPHAAGVGLRFDL